MAKNVVINGVIYSNVPSVNIPLSSGGGNATFYDSSDASAAQGDILTGKDAYINGGKKSGSMPNNGTINGSIATKDGTVQVPAGYTSGGSIGLDSTEKGKLISDNIKSGVTLFGITGSSAVLDTTIASGAAAAGNIMSGYKAYANGALVTGTATVPTISQDGSTKVLTIQ